VNPRSFADSEVTSRSETGVQGVTVENRPLHQLSRLGGVRLRGCWCNGDLSTVGNSDHSFQRLEPFAEPPNGNYLSLVNAVIICGFSLLFRIEFDYVSLYVVAERKGRCYPRGISNSLGTPIGPLFRDWDRSFRQRIAFYGCEHRVIISSQSDELEVAIRRQGGGLVVPDTLGTNCHSHSFWNRLAITQHDPSEEPVRRSSGTGVALFGTSPAIVTPTIASFTNATHTHLNAAGGGTLDTAAIASGTWAAARMPALTGECTTSAGAVSVTCGAAIGRTGNPLSQFAATTSAQLAGVISDETGTGLLVYSNNPVFGPLIYRKTKTRSGRTNEGCEHDITEREPPTPLSLVRQSDFTLNAFLA
jgi:hypothetical protein